MHLWLERCGHTTGVFQACSATRSNSSMPGARCNCAAALAGSSKQSTNGLCDSIERLSLPHIFPTVPVMSHVFKEEINTDRPIRNSIAAPTIDTDSLIFQNHVGELNKVLATYLTPGLPTDLADSYSVANLLRCALDSLDPQSTDSQKLSRLTKQQFSELLTDVCDELLRKATNGREGGLSSAMAIANSYLQILLTGVPSVLTSRSRRPFPETKPRSSKDSSAPSLSFPSSYQ